MNEAPVTDWIIHPLVGLRNGSPAGFDVYRVHNPHTSAAVVEQLDRGRIFRTELEAHAAIAKATAA